MQHPTHEIEAYFAGDLTPEQLQTLEAWINADPANARAFMQELHFRELLGERIRESRVDTRGVLAELAQLEARAQSELIHLHPTFPAQTSRWLWPAITAAALGFAALLAITLLITAPGPANPGLTVTPPTPTPPTPQAPTATPPARPVATLTATHNAQWAAPAERALAPGTKLHPGTHLTLAAGFAEITTAKGAVVILEAPATIELLNHDNAIHLHQGKLVGICETDDSKGFTVHTPTARVVDFGTQFGVEVREDGATHAAVFTGEVELSELPLSDDQPTRRVQLTDGWASQVSRNGVLQREPKPTTAQDLGRYARSIDDVIEPGFHYRRAVLSSRPLIYWGFDEGMDTTSNLAGNRDWDGKAMGQTDHGTGLFGSALKLTGKLDAMGGFVSAMPLSFAETQSYTLEAWCWLDQAHFGRVLSLAEIDEDTSIHPKHLSMIEVLDGDASPNVDKPEHPSVRFLHRYPPSSTSTQGENFFSDRAAPIGQWVHVVAVKDPQGVRVFMNGQRVAQDSTQQPVATDQPLGLYVGVSPIMLRPELSERPNDFRPFAGLIDEVAVYDTALTEDTIKQHFLLGQASTDQ